ncbi:MAG: 4Fe-4S binding protein [Lachnospiraceae bacterium]|nr:4Fe-4S binding protein [Lachnospiraceae bacterium]
MDTQHYFDLLREIRDTSMATVARDGTPRIRIIDTMLTKDHKLYFLTARGKEFYQELMRTGQVAVTGLNERWETVRLRGKVRNIGHECLDEIFEKNPSMNSVYPGDSREILEVFCLYEGQGEYFCLADHPIVRESFCFGDAPLKQRGYRIGPDCISCGTCVSVCPQGAVEEGTPFRIRQENCLHCGRCFENCPVQAISPADEGCGDSEEA